jgi:hypothetical protein
VICTEILYNPGLGVKGAAWAAIAAEAQRRLGEEGARAHRANLCAERRSSSSFERRPARRLATTGVRPQGSNMAEGVFVDLEAIRALGVRTDRVWNEAAGCRWMGDRVSEVGFALAEVLPGPGGDAAAA